MQPIQIRMNAAIVLIILLLAVPLQLFLSHYIQQVYMESVTPDRVAIEKGSLDSSGQTVMADHGGNVNDDLSSIRADAVDRLSVSLKYVAESFQETYRYYSSWEHLKELFVIPYKKPQARSNERSTIQITKNEYGEFVFSTSKENQREKSKMTKKSKGAAHKKPQVSQKDSKSSQSKSSQSEHLQSSESSQNEQKNKLKEVFEAGTSPAREVEDYLFKEVYFTHSKTPRSFKPAHVKFSVGQVVTHVTDNFYGVIVGWDEVAMAPEQWIKRHYSKRERVVKTPHYLVLLDTHFDASGVPFHYLPQEDIELVEASVQIRAPELGEYFEGYKNHRHTPRPWLKERYPND